MTEPVGVSPASVQRIWSELGLKPRGVDTFKVSDDPRLTDKLTMLLACTWTRRRR